MCAIEAQSALLRLNLCYCLSYSLDKVQSPILGGRGGHYRGGQDYNEIIGDPPLIKQYQVNTRTVIFSPGGVETGAIWTTDHDNNLERRWWGKGGGGMYVHVNGKTLNSFLEFLLFLNFCRMEFRVGARSLSGGPESFAVAGGTVKRVGTMQLTSFPRKGKKRKKNGGIRR